MALGSSLVDEKTRMIGRIRQPASRQKIIRRRQEKDGAGSVVSEISIRIAIDLSMRVHLNRPV